MIITLSAAEAFAIKAAAAHRRDLRSIAARITQDQIAGQTRLERAAVDAPPADAHADQCSRAINLLTIIATLDEPSSEIGDTLTLLGIIDRAREIVGE